MKLLVQCWLISIRGDPLSISTVGAGAGSEYGGLRVLSFIEPESFIQSRGSP
jgi:hypothetical protein